MEPQPSGDRRKPPALIRTSIANEEARDRTVVVDLLDHVESAAFTRAFEQLRWNVVQVDDMFDMLVGTFGGVELVITDDPQTVNRLPQWEISAPVVVVVDDRSSAMEGAESQGADWIIVRPVDARDPLGLGTWL